MKKIICFITIASLFTGGCTKLDEGIYDKMEADAFYATTAGANSRIADLYAEIRGDWNGKGYAGADRGWYDLNEMTTDEAMIPTRSDGAWSDNGIWRQLYQHQWTPGHEFMRNTWDWLFKAVNKSNEVVALLTKVGAPPASLSEAKVLRAFYYYMLMDGWGRVPLFTDNSVALSQVPQATRQQLFDFVVNELKNNVDNLSEIKGGTFYGRFNKWAGYTLLAKVYLNAEVYTGTAKWAEALAATNVIINQGGFSLHPNYLNIFKDLNPTDETILSIFIDGLKAPRNIIGIRTLQGPHGTALFNVSSWNGTTVHQDFVNKYVASDARKAQWAVGTQPGGVTYDLNISSLTAAGVNEGARSLKFLPVGPVDGGSASNDFPIFRYADVLLMKAEALRRTNATGAKALVDQVRARASLAPLAGEPSLDEIYDERGRELAWEGHRRQDMIRFGKFLLAHDFKGQSDSRNLLFPIPGTALTGNPNLTQNPGY
jgi:hypothetical protein